MRKRSEPIRPDRWRRLSSRPSPIRMLAEFLTSGSSRDHSNRMARSVYNEHAEKSERLGHVFNSRGKDHHQHRFGHCRRYRRYWQTGRHAYRRHAVRRGSPSSTRPNRFPPAGLCRGCQSEDQSRSRQTRPGVAPDRRRRPDACISIATRLPARRSSPVWVNPMSRSLSIA